MEDDKIGLFSVGSMELAMFVEENPDFSLEEILDPMTDWNENQEITKEELARHCQWYVDRFQSILDKIK